MANLDIIKIGGSLIYTKKGNIRKARLKKLFQIFRKNKRNQIIIVGCGKKQHDIVFKYNLTDKPKRKHGKIIHFERRVLDFQIENEFATKKLLEIANIGNFCGIRPADLFIKNGKLDGWGIVHFNECLFKSIKCPLTAGGVIPDEHFVVSAISSDTIAAYLAKYYSAKRLVLLTDVPGVYSNFKTKKILHKISYSDHDRRVIDGGMKDKLRRIQPAVLSNVPVLITSGIDFKTASKVILDKQKIGTMVIP